MKDQIRCRGGEDDEDVIEQAMDVDLSAKIRIMHTVPRILGICM